MVRRMARSGALFTLIVPAVLFWLSGGCGGSDVVVGDLDDASAPSFVAPDAADATAAETPLVSYCPSDKCPASLTTCPDSRFPCDIDVLTDVNNCGACGYKCPESGRGNASFRCLEGKCVMACRDVPDNIDCDGIPDNGCETKSTTNDNCGACGVQCSDPDKPCLFTTQGYRCGCPDGMIRCPDPNLGEACFDPKTDDANCGGCGTVCDPAGDGSEPLPNTKFGCVDSKCNKPKCERSFGTYFLDCDGDIAQPSSNGCETDAWSKDSCGGCGNGCPAGQECQGNEAFSPACACPDGMTYCPAFCLDVGGRCLAGKCVDITVDKDNCGACGNACPRVNTNDPLSAPTCNYGTCGTECIAGHADCNGNPADDCEVDTRLDPRNCGGCGIVCDAIAGQACVGGRCVVEPCDVDGGPVR